MKYSFEESSLIVGQIKELLHDFNLPMVPVYDNSTPFEGRTYVKDGKIEKYTSSGWVILDDYLYNREIANFTKNLIINSSNYDSYTHEYLGNYLRFVRDYHNVNLMSLYNCFGNKKPSRIYKKTSKTVQKPNFDSEGTIIGYDDITLNIDLDTTDNRYNYYIIPVKFNQIYTIGLDADTKYDICCLLYSNNFVTNTPDTLIKESFKTISGSRFTKPFIYKTDFSCAKDCWAKEKDLVLLLKLPNEINSSITILEGDYTRNCNVVDGTLVTNFINEEYPDEYVSKLSLLRVNNGKSYPFADRLVEYLLGNMITPLDQIDTNIERVQTLVYTDGIKGDYGIWDDQLRDNIYKIINKKDLTKGENDKFGNTIVTGTKLMDYEIVEGEELNDPKRFIDIYEDLTAYVDKDTETMMEVSADE